MGGYVLVAGSSDENHGIRVAVEGALAQSVHDLVEMKACKTGGKTGHKNIQIGRVPLAPFLHPVVDLHSIGLQRTDIGDVWLVAV